MSLLGQAKLIQERVNRALRTLNICMETLSKGLEKTELLNSICHILVATGGYKIAWIGIPEQDHAKSVRLIACSANAEGLLTDNEISWAPTEAGDDPTGTAIRLGTYQIARGSSTAPITAWKKAALKYGYQSCLALPIKNSSGTTMAALSIYASVADAFNEAEILLLQNLALGLGIALENRQYGEIFEQSMVASVKSIADMVEKQQSGKSGYERRVGHLSAAIASSIAKEVGLSKDRIHNIEVAAWVHDIGNVTMPLEILTKTTRLDEGELALVKSHAQVGYELLKSINLPGPIATIVWQHHERLDGSGYPQGLKGNEILMEARIIAVADVIESMATYRPYRQNSPGLDAALGEINRGKGTLYDETVVDACLKLFAEERYSVSN
jgi:hypothetical protein